MQAVRAHGLALTGDPAHHKNILVTMCQRYSFGLPKMTAKQLQGVLEACNFSEAGVYLDAIMAELDPYHTGVVPVETFIAAFFAPGNSPESAADIWQKTKTPDLQGLDLHKTTKGEAGQSRRTVLPAHLQGTITEQQYHGKGSGHSVHYAPDSRGVGSERTNPHSNSPIAVGLYSYKPYGPGIDASQPSPSDTLGYQRPHHSGVHRHYSMEDTAQWDHLGTHNLRDMQPGSSTWSAIQHQATPHQATPPPGIRPSSQASPHRGRNTSAPPPNGQNIEGNPRDIYRPPVSPVSGQRGGVEPYPMHEGHYAQRVEDAKDKELAALRAELAMIKSGGAPPPAHPALATRKAADQGHEQLFSQDCTAILAKFRETLLRRRGSHALHGLKKIFSKMDRDQNATLDEGELARGLEDLGLKMTKRDIHLLISAIDTNGDGVCSLSEFISAVRGPIKANRLALINEAFKTMDADGNGVIKLDDLRKDYGDTAKRASLEMMLAQFDVIESDGVVTMDEFKEYYRDLSTSMRNDDDFELMMRNSYHISGGHGKALNSTNMRVLVTFKDGRKEMIALENDLHIDKYDHTALMAQLEKQGEREIHHVDAMGSGWN